MVDDRKDQGLDEMAPLGDVVVGGPPPVDHRALLVKYIRLVRAHEGTDFICAIEQTRERPADELWDPGASRTQDAELAFTDADLAEVQRLAAEAGR